jgi:hypothetical protein
MTVSTILEYIASAMFLAAKLVKEGRLRYVGPLRGGHWEVLT